MSVCVLDQLAEALAQERRALLEHDVPGLMESSQAKRAALQALESTPPEQQDARLPELIAANRLNGALLAGRRREVDVILRHLGGHAATPAYDMHGHCPPTPSRRMLAVA